MRDARPRTDEPRPTFFDRVGGWMDGIVCAFSPSRGNKRLLARHLNPILRRRLDRARDRGGRNSGYETARDDRIREDKWLRSRLSPDTDLEYSLVAMREKCEELYRTDQSGGAVDGLVNQVVGDGFTALSRIRETPGVITKAEAETLPGVLEEFFREWAKRADVNRKRSFWQICRLAKRSWLNSGEAIVVMSDVGDADSEIPLVLEVVNSARLETPPSEVNNPRVRLGVEKDKTGKIVAYWIRDTHPHDHLENKLTYTRYEAWRVCHVFEAYFPGQTRGLPWLFRVANKIRDRKDLDEYSIIAAQVQAAQSTYIKSETLPGIDAAEGNAGGLLSNGQRYEEAEPATVRYLNPGEEPINIGPTHPSNLVYGQFMEWNQRGTASGINYPYELYAKDWSGVSFAGGRLVLQEARVDWTARQKFLVELLLEVVWSRAITEGVILGVLPIDPRKFEANRRAYLRHAWAPPRWPYSITPKEEIEAAILRVENNFSTLEDEVAAGGGDAYDVIDRRAGEKKYQADKDVLPATQQAAAGPPPPSPQEKQLTQELEASAA